MMLTIELEPDTEARLRAEAAAGRDLPDYVQSLLQEHPAEEDAFAPPATAPGEDYWDGYIGVLAGNGAYRARDVKAVFEQVLTETAFAPR